MKKPTHKPLRPYYSSGPCAKRPGWSPAALEKYFLAGRSHRSAAAKQQLVQVAERSRALLGIPADYKIAIMAGSDTGAFEAALWSMLGARPVDVYAWEVFSAIWTNDIVKQMKLPDTREFSAPFGDITDFSTYDPARDTVFTWNGTTSGVRTPNADWISDTRTGLVFCDAISGIFAMPLPWEKLDVVSWSWQKALGGEAQHGMLALSPRAIERLNTYTPAWPLPKIFRMTKKGGVNDALFTGDVLNTPSMLCVADVLDALDWADAIGGLPALIERTNENSRVVAAWVDRTPWVEYLAADPAIRSTTAHCIKVVSDRVATLDETTLRDTIKKICGLVEKEGAGFDLTGHRDAPPNIRMWTGPTVETADIKLTLEWLEWAYAEALA
jgi:phosphoserine aminotransferase